MSGGKSQKGLNASSTQVSKKVCSGETGDALRWSNDVQPYLLPIPTIYLTNESNHSQSF